MNQIMTIPDLKTKILGPTLSGQISAIQPFNELLYVAVGNKIYKFHFLHLLNQYEFSADIQTMLLAGEILIILLKEENRVVVRNVKTGLNLTDLTLEFQPLGLLHPPTYLNKVVFWAEQSLALYNVNTANKLISFDQVPSVSKLIVTGKRITLVEASPAVDIVAIGFETGLLGLVNLKTGAVLRSFQASARLNCVGFSMDITRTPLLLTGDDSGSVLNWDLNKGELLHAHRSAHNSRPISFLSFLNFEGKDMYLTGSEADNSIKLWNKQDPADTQYYALRTRAGCVSSLKDLQFFGPEGTHILGFSGDEACEILDFSLLREDMTAKLSRKDGHVTKYTATERSEHIGQVLSASATHNRSGDWPSLITANKGNLRPCFWDVEDRTIVKLSAQLYDSGKAKKLTFIEDIGRERRFISKVAITTCGNFGVAGYNNGYIVKISMQNAGHIKTFYNTQVHQKKEILGLLVDSLNRFLVSADDETLALWDFYSGIFQRKIDLSGFAVKFLVPDEHSQIFGIVTTTAEVRLMEYATLQEVRVFTGASKGEINDCKHSSDNRLHHLQRKKDHHGRH